MQLRIYFNVLCQVLFRFLPWTRIRWVIQRCFQQITWWRWWQGIKQHFDIISCRMDTFLFLSVFHSRFAACWYSGTCCSLLIQASISAWFFCSSVSSRAFRICLSALQASSWRWRSSSPFPESSSLYHYDAICLPVLDYPCLSCKKHQKPVDHYFCQGDIKDPVYDRLFCNHPLLQTHSIKEQDNVKLHPSKIESTEQHVEEIIHYFPVWILSPRRDTHKLSFAMA